MSPFSSVMKPDSTVIYRKFPSTTSSVVNSCICHVRLQKWIFTDLKILTHIFLLLFEQCSIWRRQLQNVLCSTAFILWSFSHWSCTGLGGLWMGWGTHLWACGWLPEPLGSSGVVLGSSKVPRAIGVSKGDGFVFMWHPWNNNLAV